MDYMKIEDFWGNEVKKQEPEEEEKKEEKKERAKVKKILTRHRIRRILSEDSLEKELPWHFEKGVSYHCISHGDVDALTYLRVIVKQQPLKYAILSTWCMALEDIIEIERWLKKGYIKRIDFFLGEIFRGTYYREYDYLKEVCKKYNCRMVIFRNHSKVMVAYGDSFNAVIESSANVNTNPRTEQTCITVNTELCNFYKDFFDNIKSFERDFDYIEKMEL